MAPHGDSLSADALTVNNENENVATFDELVYGAESFYAIVGPVFLTMILSALAVVFISTPESKAQGEENLSNSYVVFDADEDDSNGEKLGLSVVNGLIIVSFMGAMTFVIVLLYKYRCMKILLGYMIVASAMLLGFLSSEMLFVAMDRYNLHCDKISFAVFIYNFAAVGTFSIFFGKGVVPSYIAQAYLVATSVIVAWHLSHFEPWTAWVLLVLMALYDLFAVLTPCGPLKALVRLMQREDAPEMPGLLYEAHLPSAGRNPNNRRARTPEDNPAAIATASPSSEQENELSGNGVGHVLNRDQNENGLVVTDEGVVDIKLDSSSQRLARDTVTVPETSLRNGCENADEAREIPVAVDQEDDSERPSAAIEISRGMIPLAIALHAHLALVNPPLRLSSDQQEGANWTPEELRREVEVFFPVTGWRYALHSVQLENEETRYALLDPEDKVNKVFFVNEQGRLFEDVRYREPLTGMVPLAVAKMNKLALAEGPQPSWVRRSSTENEEPEAEEYTAEELRQEVKVVFPRSGWRIVKHSRQRENEEFRYAIVKPDGSIKRIVFVNEEGKVFEDLRDKNEEAAAAERRKERTSIRLGLGDFIFYSILVSKAALFSFATFCACTISITIGLALTLLMLAFNGKALPALPISIFLGVGFYLITRYSLEPWMQEVFIQETYV